MTIKFQVKKCNKFLSQPHWHAFMLDGDKKVEIKFQERPKKAEDYAHQSYFSSFYYLLTDYLNLSCKPFSGEINYTLEKNYIEAKYNNITLNIELPSLCLPRDNKLYGFTRKLPDTHEYEWKTGQPNGEIKVKQLALLFNNPLSDRFSAYFGYPNSMHLLSDSSNILVEK